MCINHSFLLPNIRPGRKCLYLHALFFIAEHYHRVIALDDLFSIMNTSIWLVTRKWNNALETHIKTARQFYCMYCEFSWSIWYVVLLCDIGYRLIECFNDLIKSFKSNWKVGYGKSTLPYGFYYEFTTFTSLFYLSVAKVPDKCLYSWFK